MLIGTLKVEILKGSKPTIAAHRSYSCDAVSEIFREEFKDVM
jgi:hypothetical protein